MSVEVPEGFVPVPMAGGGFIQVNGPLYVKAEGTTLIVGFRVEERHCNPMGMCHGGMLMTFADMLMPMGVHFQSEEFAQFLPTIAMSTDFLAPAPRGAWLEGRTEVLKVTRNLVFAEGKAWADGELVLRTSGTFKRGPKFGDLGLKIGVREVLK